MFRDHVCSEIRCDLRDYVMIPEGTHDFLRDHMISEGSHDYPKDHMTMLLEQ